MTEKARPFVNSALLQVAGGGFQQTLARPLGYVKTAKSWRGLQPLHGTSEQRVMACGRHEEEHREG